MHIFNFLHKSRMSIPYYTGQCTGIDTLLVLYWKKYLPYQPYRRNPAVSVGKWILSKDREIPKKNSHEFSELTQSCCTWPKPEPEPELMLARQETSSRSWSIFPLSRHPSISIPLFISVLRAMAYPSLFVCVYI